MNVELNEYKLEMRRLLTQAAEQLTILNQRDKSKKLYEETNDLIGRLLAAAIATLTIDA